jgi:hypothetical protein
MASGAIGRRFESCRAHLSLPLALRSRGAPSRETKSPEPLAVDVSLGPGLRRAKRPRREWPSASPAFEAALAQVVIIGR